MPDNRQEWDEFVEVTAKKLPEPQAKAVHAFWAAVSTTNPLLPLPGVTHEEETVHFAWSRVGHILDVEIWPDGLCEWFDVTGPASNRCTEGTLGDREPVPTETIIRRLYVHFPD